MRRLLLLAALIVAASLPSAAFALDMDFYTYDGFTETVNAFKRISLVFANNEYTTLFAVAVVLGLLLGGLFTVGKGIINFQQSATGLSLAWLMTTLIGVAVFKALITPTGTVHVYDPVRNAYEAVPGVPDLIVLAAGMTNKAERVVQQIVDASAAHPYGTEGMGVGFELLLNATTDKTFSSDYYLQKSIRQYFKDCSKLALVLPSYAVDLADIKSGTDDLRIQLAAMKSPAMFTTMFSAGAGKAGAVMSCQDAYDNELAPVLNAAPTFDEHLNSVCTKSGFDISVAAQKSACETKIQGMNLNIFGSAAAPPTQLLRNVVISNAIASVMLDENPDAGIRALTNRSMVNNGLGIAVSANEWMPKIRASVTAIVLGLIPILALFIVTPLFPMALKLIVALLGWLMLWGVMDVILAQIATDQAYDAVDEIKRHNMGLSAIFLAPESATQALSLFGKARGMGITISAFIAAMLFKMSPYGLASLAGNWSGHADSAGSDAASRSQSPVESMNHLNSLASARGSANLMAETGWDNISSVSEFNQSESHYRGLETMSGMADLGNTNPISAGKALGAYGAGSVVGGVAGAIQSNGGDNSPEALYKQGLKTSDVESQVRHGGASGRQESATTMGFRSVNSQAAYDTAMSVSSTSSDNMRIGTMLDRIQEQHDGMDRGEAFQALATAKNADLWGQLDSANWHPSELVTFSEFTANMNNSQLRGMMGYMAETGLTPSEIYESVGAKRAATSHGENLALDQVTPRQFAIATAYENIKQVANAEEGVNQGINRPEGVEGYLRDSARIQHASTGAGIDRANTLENRTGWSWEEQAQRETSANFGSFYFSQEDMQKGVQTGWLTQEQVDASPNGARVTLATDGSGGVVHSSALSGNNATVDDRITKDSRYSETDSVYLDTGGRVDTPSLGKLALSNDQSDTQRLADILQRIQGDGEEGNRFAAVARLTQILDSINTSTVTGDDSIGTRAEGGVSTGMLENFGLTGSITGHTSTGIQETESTNMNRERLTRMAENTFDILNGEEVRPGQDASLAAAQYVQTEFQSFYAENQAEADLAFDYFSNLEDPKTQQSQEEDDRRQTRRGRR